MRMLLVCLCLGWGSALVAQPLVDTSWPSRGTEALDPSLHLNFSLDMAGASGEAEFTYDKNVSVQIRSATLVLSMDGGPMFCQEIQFDLQQSSASNAVLGTVSVESGRTAVEFTSTLGFVRKQAGLLSVTYTANGKEKTAFNDRLLESRLLGRWILDADDSFAVVFRPDHTVVWGKGASPSPWQVKSGELLLPDLPTLYRSEVEFNGESVALRGSDVAVRLRRDFGSDRDAPPAPVASGPRVNRLKAPEDYSLKHGVQRVGGASGDDLLHGFSDPKATKQSISGSKDGWRFVVVSSDPASAIVVYRGGKEVGRRSSNDGFLLATILKDETDRVELWGVGFNPDSQHHNTWGEMFAIPSGEDGLEQAPFVLATWQARENKPWVVLVQRDGRFEDLFRR